MMIIQLVLTAIILGIVYKKMLKWEPKVSLEQGLKETIAYFRTKIDKVDRH